MSNEMTAAPNLPRPSRRPESDDVASPPPEWRAYVDAWNDPKERALVARGDREGKEYLAAGTGLAANILRFWLAERLGGGAIPPILDAAARSILARQAAPRDHQIFGPNEKLIGVERFVDSPSVVPGPDGRRYWLSLGPFYYRPGGTPSERAIKHPGPGRGEVAVVAVPEPPSRAGILPDDFEVV